MRNDGKTGGTIAEAIRKAVSDEVEQRLKDDPTLTKAAIARAIGIAPNEFYAFLAGERYKDYVPNLVDKSVAHLEIQEVKLDKKLDKS